MFDSAVQELPSMEKMLPDMREAFRDRPSSELEQLHAGWETYEEEPFEPGARKLYLGLFESLIVERKQEEHTAQQRRDEFDKRWSAMTMGERLDWQRKKQFLTREMRKSLSKSLREVRSKKKISEKGISYEDSLRKPGDPPDLLAKTFKAVWDRNLADPKTRKRMLENMRKASEMVNNMSPGEVLATVDYLGQRSLQSNLNMYLVGENDGGKEKE